MSLTRVQDPKISQRMLVEQFRRNFVTTNNSGEVTNVNIQAAQNALNGSRANQITIKSDTFNPSIEAVYEEGVYYENNNTTDLQTTQFRVLQKIGIPPEKYVINNAYSIGDLVYLNSIEDESLYYCIQNISEGTAYDPLTQSNYWQITPNYYSESSYLEILQKWIDQMLQRPIEIYNSETTYYKNNWVYCGNYYELDSTGVSQPYQGNVVALCITENENGIINQPPTPNSSEWVQFGLQGERGMPSLGVQYRGKWTANTDYPEKSMVLYESNGYRKLYISTQQVSSSTPPDQDTTHWESSLEINTTLIPIFSSSTTNMGLYALQYENQLTYYWNTTILYPRTYCSQISIDSSSYEVAGSNLETVYQNMLSYYCLNN